MSLRRFQFRLVALLPAKSMILHLVACWQESRWDSEPACFSSLTVANELTCSQACGSTAAI